MTSGAGEGPKAGSDHGRARWARTAGSGARFPTRRQLRASSAGDVAELLVTELLLDDARLSVQHRVEDGGGVLQVTEKVLWL